MGHTLRHGGLLRGGRGGGKEKGKGNAQIKIFQPKNWDMGCETLERSNSWRGTEPSGDGWLRQTSLSTVYSMMMIIFDLSIIEVILKV